MPKFTKKNRPTILIVDDDISLLRAIARLIRAGGYEPRTFERPSLLLAAELPKTNACLVLDLNLPEMNGVELFDALTISGRVLPLVMITGQRDLKTRRLLRGLDAWEVLFKPFDGELLLAAIERALSTKRAG